MKPDCQSTGGRRASAGFTFVELVMVITVLGVVGGVAAIKFSNTGQIKVGLEAERLARDITHVRSLAMTNGLRMRIGFNFAGGWYGFYCVPPLPVSPPNPPVWCNGALPIRDPANPVLDGVTSQPVYRLDSSVVFLGGASNLYFDTQGRPVNAAGTPFNVVRTVRLTDNSLTQTYTVRVQPRTGHVTFSAP